METNTVTQNTTGTTGTTDTQTVDVQVNTQTPQSQTQTQTQPKPESDILSRINQLKQNVKPVEGETKFDLKEIENIQDPVAKEQAMNAYKSFQRGFNQKFQELSNLRKTLEGKGTIQTWTPEAVQGLMQNPEFIQAAQSVMANYNQSNGQMTSEEWSALTESEKRQFNQMQQQLQLIARQNTSLIQAQQDERLKTKYANYDPKIIDSMTQELLTGRYQATREDIWKVIDYENMARRAYELGKQDRQLNLNEQVNSITTDGVNTVATDTVPAKENGESNYNYFRRLAQRRLAEARSGKTK